MAVLRTNRRRGVWVIVADAHRRETLEAACRAAGLSVLSSGYFREVGEWPAEQMVIIDAAQVTSFWRAGGAVEVMALVETAEDAFAVLARGATTWMRSAEDAAAVSRRLRRLSATRPRGDVARTGIVLPFVTRTEVTANLGQPAY
jgi:hypothetical protein